MNTGRARVEIVMKKILVCGLAAILSACMGTAGDPEDPTSEEIKAELDARLAPATLIYHTGCDQVSACADPLRYCAADVDTQIRADLNATTAATVEWECPSSTEGIHAHTWFLEPDGSGDAYFYLSTDVQGGDCGGLPCGWNKISYASGELFAADQLSLHVFGPYSDNDHGAISQFTACAYP